MCYVQNQTWMSEPSHAYSSFCLKLNSSDYFAICEKLFFCQLVTIYCWYGLILCNLEDYSITTVSDMLIKDFKWNAGSAIHTTTWKCCLWKYTHKPEMYWIHYYNYSIQYKIISFQESRIQETRSLTKNINTNVMLWLSINSRKLMQICNYMH